MNKRARSMNLLQAIAGYLFCAVLAIPASAQNKAPSLPTGVEKLCTIGFDKDTRRQARVEDSALPCLEEAVNRLNANRSVKLVLVGVKDPSRDHEAAENGMMREKEDTTGYDIRLEDLAAYRSLNAKDYLVRWYRIDPARILPTTDEAHFGREVTFYLVPGDADFNHNYLGTTKTNERPCTVKPCYPPDEETLAAQPRARITTTSKSSSAK
jgi:hypothetical protein